MERERHITIETVDWQGITLSVSFEAAYLGLTWNAHLQVQSVTPERAPLPMTETGYRSLVTHPEVIADAGGPIAFVLAWLEESAISPEWRMQQQAAQQLSLF